MVSDEETVVIGGLIRRRSSRTNETRCRGSGDIPILGWLFKSTDRIDPEAEPAGVPDAAHHAQHAPSTSARRSASARSSGPAPRPARSSPSEREAEQQRARRRRRGRSRAARHRRHEPRALPAGEHGKRYPLERMREIEARQDPASLDVGETAAPPPARWRLPPPRLPARMALGRLAATFARRRRAATTLLTELVDAGYDGTLVATRARGHAALRDAPRPLHRSAEAERAAAGVRERVRPRADGRDVGAEPDRVSGALRTQLEHLGPRARSCCAPRGSRSSSSRRRCAASRRFRRPAGGPHRRARLPRRRGSAARARRAARPAGAPEVAAGGRRHRAARAAADRLRQGPRRAAAAARPQTARCASRSPNPLDTTALDDLRLLFDGAEVQTELVTRRAILVAHQPGLRPRPSARSPASSRTPSRTSTALASEISARAAGPARGAGRGADHPPGELAAPAGREGARQRHPHRAVREASSASASASTACSTSRSRRCRSALQAEHRLAHQDHGRPQHRREAPAAGRPHPPQDRRHATSTSASRPCRSRTASAS